MTAAIKIVVILAVYRIVRLLVFKLIYRMMKLPMLGADDEHGVDVRKARMMTLQSILRSASGFVLAFVAVVMVLQTINYNPIPILATASVAGVAIGFGAQKLVRDVITGFFILMEDQYGVGEYVTIGAVTGVVQELGMRTTKVRDAAGRLYTISNGDISTVCNHSRGALLATLDIAVPAATDLDKARSVINEAGDALAREMPDVVKRAFRCEGLAAMSGANATLRVVGGVVAIHQDQALMELKGRIREAFAENDLTLA